VWWSEGDQRSEVVCVEKEAGIVEERFCNASTKPDDMHKSCNDHQCPARHDLHRLNIVSIIHAGIFIFLQCSDTVGWAPGRASGL